MQLGLFFFFFFVASILKVDFWTKTNDLMGLVFEKH